MEAREEDARLMSMTISTCIMVPISAEFPQGHRVLFSSTAGGSSGPADGPLLEPDLADLCFPPTTISAPEFRSSLYHPSK